MKRGVLPILIVAIAVCSLAGLDLAGAQPAGPAAGQPLSPLPQEPAPGGAPAEQPPSLGPSSALEPVPPPPGASQTLTTTADEKEKPAASTPLPEKAPTPIKRPRRSQAIIQALDKVTAQTVRFPADINKPVRWKDLVFTVHACEEAASDEVQKGAFAHVEVYSEPKVGPGRTPPPAKMVYRGWMYSEAPAAHAFEHPVYDVWLIACRTV